MDSVKNHLKLVLVLLISGLIVSCSPRVVVNLYPSDPHVVDLPICYLENCNDDTEENCALKAYETFLASKSSVWTLLNETPKAVLIAGKRQYYVQAKPRSTLDELQSRWGELGCTPSNSDTVSESRLLTCTSNMADWVKQSNSEGQNIQSLSLNGDFRSACLRE